MVLDWSSKKLRFTKMNSTSKTAAWIDTRDGTVNFLFPLWIRIIGWIPNMVSHHDCQPTSLSFLKACFELSIEQICASSCNPKGNADTAHVVQTLKEYLVWTHEFDNISQFEEALKQWMKAY